MRKLFLLATFLATAALAQTVTDQFKVDLGPKDHKADHVFEQRVYVVGRLLTDGGCIGCSTGIGTTTWDFPALGNGALDAPCAESANVTIPGALILDGCDPATNLGADGGAVLLSTANLTCRAGNGFGVLKLCVQLTDGGSYDLGDAGFTLRTSR